MLFKPLFEQISNKRFKHVFFYNLAIFSKVVKLTIKRQHRHYIVNTAAGWPLDHSQLCQVSGQK